MQRWSKMHWIMPTPHCSNIIHHEKDVNGSKTKINYFDAFVPFLSLVSCVTCALVMLSLDYWVLECSLLFN